MSRMGRVHRPFFRINAVDQRAPRNGSVVEQLGWYDPKAKDPAKQVQLNEERVKYWLSVGAQPSDTMNDFLAKRGLIDADAWKAKRAARVKRKLAMQAKAAAAAPGKTDEKKKEA
jgi:small subunit ribosomal protein S16